MNLKAFAVLALVTIYVAVVVGVLLLLTHQRSVSSFEATTPEVRVEPYKSTKKRRKIAVPRFAEIDSIRERKAAFLRYFAEKATEENRRITALRQRLNSAYAHWHRRGSLKRRDARFIDKLRQRYRVGDALEGEALFQSLLARVNVIPVALVQVQAALESGWGTSRFAREGNNFFGQWCFSKGCGMVPSNRVDGKNHEVARFSDPVKSLQAYMLNLNSYAPYDEFRQQRVALEAKGLPLSALVLSEALLSYSERGQAYVEQVQGMIRHNGLE